MLIKTVNKATIMVNCGSTGGGVREQEEFKLFQVHCVAPDWILDGMAVQDTY